MAIIRVQSVQTGGGGGVNPVGRWQWELITAITITNPSANVPVINLGDYDELLVCCERVTTSVGSGIFIHVSIDNGASYLANIYDFIGQAGELNPVGDMDLVVGAPAGSKSPSIHFFRFNSTDARKLAVVYNRLDATTGPYQISQSSPLNALRLDSDAGNLTGGILRVLGKGKT